MTPTLKRKLLDRINAGMDTDSACAELGIPITEIAAASKRLKELIGTAETAGSARLRGRLFKNALAGDDTRYLQDLLDRRAQVGAKTITVIERRILSPPGGHCVHCGKAQGTPNPSKRTNGQAAHD